MPVQNVVHVRTSKKEVSQVIRQIPKVVAGNVAVGSSLVQSLLVRIGMTALARIRDAFVVKARGGADESGLSWRKLSPKTVAYSRRHPGVPKNRKNTRPSWILKADEKKRWWRLYSIYLAAYKGDKGHAAAHAWLVLKGEGARTLLDVYGNTQVEILRDTGVLLNSLSPGIVVGAGPAPSSPPKKKHQIFQVGRGYIILGTNRKGAGAHHRGTRKIPQRRLWPEPRRWPKSWWADILTQARQGVIDIFLFLLR